MDIQLVVGETVILLITPLDTRGQGWLLTDDIYRVILTIRETKESAVILTLDGVVEAKGQTVDNSGKLAVLVHSEDTKDLPVGEYFYDVVMVKKGHWFDIEDYDGLYLEIGYGKIKAGAWKEIERGWIELTDDTVNFVQITKTGEYKITTGDYEKDGEGNYINDNLYRIITVEGSVADVYPYSDWFKAGTHSGLDFYYEAGKVLDSSNVLQDVSAGHITLKPSRTNYIEIDSAGVITSIITRFSSGRYPLYEVETSEDSITTVAKQENNFVFDDRAKSIRGDSYIPSVKANVSVIWTPTKVEED